MHSFCTITLWNSPQTYYVRVQLLLFPISAKLTEYFGLFFSSTQAIFYIWPTCYLSMLCIFFFPKLCVTLCLSVCPFVRVCLSEEKSNDSAFDCIRYCSSYSSSGSGMAKERRRKGFFTCKRERERESRALNQGYCCTYVCTYVCKLTDWYSEPYTVPTIWLSFKC